MSQRNVPRSALMFAAAVALTAAEDLAQDAADEASENEAGTPPPPYPITILARTAGHAYQGYWGRCVHDMKGFIVPSGPVPLDWNHGEDADIGVGESFAITDGGLEIKGRLIPFTANDRAAQLIYKGQEGVPYQASVVMSPENLVVTEVPEGAVFTVNGRNETGPLTVFSQWSIDGVSILLYGADAGSAVQFSRDQSQLAVTVNTLKEPHVEPKPETPTELPADALTFSRSEMERWKANFGAESIQWFIDGTAASFEAAALHFGRKLSDQVTQLNAKLAERDATIAALTTERDELKQRLEFRRGHATPARMEPPADQTEERRETANPAHFGVSSAMHRFTQAIAAKLTAKTAAQ
ncbi:MAG: hypothetical protein U0941_29995 [Planctomycetaceae bacterium]